MPEQTPRECPKCRNTPGRYFFVRFNCYGDCFPCKGTGFLPDPEVVRIDHAIVAARQAIIAEVKTRPNFDRVDFETGDLGLRRRVLTALDRLAINEPERLPALVRSVQNGRTAAVVDALAAL